MNFFGIGGFELIIIAGLAFFLLGPKKMIETSRSAGKLIRELKAERDKFTNMIMSEFDDADDKPSGANQSSAATGPEVTPEAPVDAVSRPRGRMQGLADEGSSDVPEDDPAETSEDDDPDTAAGGSA